MYMPIKQLNNKNYDVQPFLGVSQFTDCAWFLQILLLNNTLEAHLIRYKDDWQVGYFQNYQRVCGILDFFTRCNYKPMCNAGLIKGKKTISFW